METDDDYEEHDFQPSAPMAKYAGYGLSKARPMLQAVQSGSWPRAYSTQDVYQNLRLVTRQGSQENTPFRSGDVAELVGIFSVHLGRALRDAQDASSRDTAVPVASALEFFVFARAAKPAVKNSKCQAEP